MPFVKDTTYRDIPFSYECPGDDFHTFLTVTELVEKMKTKKGQIFRCRTVGTVASSYGKHIIQELDDSEMQIRLSLAYAQRSPPFAGKPYSAQLFGFVHWKEGVGPIIFAQLLQSIPACIAVRLRETMKWVIDTHYAFVADAEKKEE